MDASLIVNNLLSPPILFFFFGLLATFLKSDLEIPQPLPKVFALYLLFSIGFRGGVELHESGVNRQVAFTLLAAILMASLVPIYAFFVLRIKIVVHDAAAIAAPTDQLAPSPLLLPPRSYRNWTSPTAGTSWPQWR